MINKTFIYPGSFCPPTYGHVHIAETFVKQYGQPLIVICSENPDKDKQKIWFSKQDCVKLWKSYNLSNKISVITIDQFINMKVNVDNIVMIRGLRNKDDANYEKEIMIYNQEKFNITQYLYIFGNKLYENVSSSNVRNNASNFDFHDMYLSVSYKVITELWKHITHAKSISMAVGRPGSGKTTVLSGARKKYSNEIYYINTDNYNRKLKPRLQQYFNCVNLIEIAKTRQPELINVIGKSWLDLLFNHIKNDISEIYNKHVVIEIAYGLQPHKNLFRYIGQNILHFYCDNNYDRNRDRNTENLSFFIDKIPDYTDTIKICEDNNLKCINVNTQNSSVQSSINQLMTLLNKYLIHK